MILYMLTIAVVTNGMVFSTVKIKGFESEEMCEIMADKVYVDVRSSLGKDTHVVTQCDMDENA